MVLGWMLLLLVCLLLEEKILSLFDLHMQSLMMFLSVCWIRICAICIPFRVRFSFENGVVLILLALFTANCTDFWQFAPPVIPGEAGGAIAETICTILNSLLRHLRCLVGDTLVCFVKFDGGSEFVTEDALQVYFAWQLDYSINCPSQ